MTFFRGSEELGLQAHEDLAAEIGTAGKDWARDHVSFFHFDSIHFSADVASN